MSFPNRGEGGSPTWEKFPHFPVFFGGSVPNPRSNAPLEKKSQKTDHRGGGVNPYGQPDRKILFFFFDGFPYHAASPFSLWFLAISEHIAFHLSYQLMGELNKESTIP